MKKELLELLRDECIKRDFKTVIYDGEKIETSICGIIIDMRNESIITPKEKRELANFLNKNKPKNIEKYGEWFKSKEDRIEFLNQKINE